MTYPEFPDEQPQYPEPSQATTVLVLGIVGIFVSIVAPIAWVMGQNELRAIDGGRRPPDNRDTANAGRILGIIGTFLLALLIIVLIVAFVAFFSIGVFEFN